MKLVILDDDPTGTQSVHDLDVLTVWDKPTLQAAFANDDPAFFILTNSRALPAEAAKALNEEIAHALQTAAGTTPFTVVSRSDSTLRGHFPLETDVLESLLGPFDGTILIPFFEAGGRLTIEDIHYIKEGAGLTPVAESPFAKDASFGYRSSNLREYVAEKTKGRVNPSDVVSIAVDLSPKDIADILVCAKPGSYFVVNSQCLNDLKTFCAGLALAEARGKRYLFRTASDFIPARIQQSHQGLLDGNKFRTSDGQDAGGLVVAGSYVPKTTQQLAILCQDPDIHVLELSVPELLGPSRNPVLEEAAAFLHTHLSEKKDVLLMTSRELIKANDPEESLRIGNAVSSALVKLVQELEIQPAWLIAKGGITSSDTATQALGIRRARILGQILSGVPVWSADTDSKFPALPYIVFPGNVGTQESLLEAVNRCRGNDQ